MKFNTGETQQSHVQNGEQWFAWCLSESPEGIPVWILCIIPSLGTSRQGITMNAIIMKDNINAHAFIIVIQRKITSNVFSMLFFSLFFPLLGEV